MVQGYTSDEDSRVFITPECTLLDELEGHINALQHDLDELRARAKRAFHRET